jgi:hypothetical protein
MAIQSYHNVYHFQYEYANRTESRWYPFGSGFGDGCICNKNHPEGLKRIVVERVSRELTLHDLAELDDIMNYWPVDTVEQALATYDYLQDQLGVA